MRNKKELYCARIEDIDWNHRVFFIPDSKTDNGRRFVPISDRALELLKARCGERREGWVFTAFSASGHLTTMGRKFREARREAGLPEKLVLYCGRHDYGTRVLQGPAILQLSCAPWARQSINGNEVSTSRTGAGAPRLEWHKKQSPSRTGIVMAHSTAQ